MLHSLNQVLFADLYSCYIYNYKYLYLKAQPETLKTVQSTIAKQLSIDESTVAPNTKFADLGADSLDTVCFSHLLKIRDMFVYILEALLYVLKHTKLSENSLGQYIEEKFISHLLI